MVMEIPTRYVPSTDDNNVWAVHIFLTNLNHVRLDEGR